MRRPKLELDEEELRFLEITKLRVG